MPHRVPKLSTWHAITAGWTDNTYVIQSLRGILSAMAEIPRSARNDTETLDSQVARESSRCIGDALRRRVRYDPARAVWTALHTRSGVSGSSVTRAPHASRTALAHAAAQGMTGGSPTPLAPNGPRPEGTSTMTASRSGDWLALGMV